MWRSKVWSSIVICHLVLNVAVTDTAIWKSRRGWNDHETSVNECWQCLIYASTWRDIHSRRRWNLIMTKSLSHFSLLPKWIKNNEVKLCTSLLYSSSLCLASFWILIIEMCFRRYMNSSKIQYLFGFVVLGCLCTQSTVPCTCTYTILDTIIVYYYTRIWFRC